VRLLHWSLALTVIVAFLLHESDGIASLLSIDHHVWHERIGYAALAVAAARIAWGLWGGRGPARFTAFVRGPAATLAYARRLITRREPRYLGHNPLGAWMVVALLANTLLAGLTGWLFTTDRFWGAEWLEELHGLSGELFAPLVLLHLAGVVYTSWRHRENLVAAMMTGDKPAPAPGDIAA
jgi:cytochrome b